MSDLSPGGAHRGKHGARVMGNPWTRADLIDAGMFAHQADAAISQANPVSTTLYQVLPTTTNVRLIGISANITWGVTQPTPLDVLITVDGRTELFRIDNPVSASFYYANFSTYGATNPLSLSTTPTEQSRSFLLEGKSIKVEVRITWAVTQPTPLTCRVKWARKV